LDVKAPSGEGGNV